MSYDLEPIEAPRLAGTMLKIFTRLLENGLTQKLLFPKLLRDAGIEKMRKFRPCEAPSVRPPLEGVGEGRGGGETPIDLSAIYAAAPGPPTPFPLETVRDFHEAYRAGRTTPLAVARRLVEALRAADADQPPLRAMIAWRSEEIFEAAEASTRRWEAGTPLGPLDGIPVVVKDELDQRGYPTTVGTTFLGKRPAAEDATVVARLRAAGALLCGKANMHEIGLGVTGLNPHHGTPRNPYDPGHHTGGSSSGPAAAVAAGLTPIAVGADGGGSIRIPAAFCGAVGLKATWGRISEAGAFPLCWSVAHVGPIAASAADCLLAYAAMAGPDPKDPHTALQPPLSDPTAGERDGIEGLKLGIFRPWFEDADPDVVRSCSTLLEAFKKRGATVVEIEIPELDLARVAHLVTIVSEMATSIEPHYPDHRFDFGLDVRANLMIAFQLTNRDYVKAQQIRTRVVRHLARLYETVDLIVTPTTGCTAPVIRNDALRYGESDLPLLSKVMRFAFLANLTGAPAISFPAGHDAKGLPVGLQAIAPPWEEERLFRLAFAAEHLVERQPPKRHFSLLR